MSFIPSIQACPHCSRPLSFGSDAINLKQCSCGKIIRRGEDGALTVTLVEAIEAPFDIIQPGTTGSWNNKRFTVLGRFRTWYKGGVYNYWDIELQDGEHAWLAEGYGIYAVLTPHQLNLSVPKSFTESLKPGQQYKFGTDTLFVLDRRLTCSRWEAEAELRMPEADNHFKIAELSTINGAYIAVFEFRADQFTVFDISYQPFSSFGFRHLRPYSNPGKEFRCGECSNTIIVKTYPFSQGAGCIHCGTEYFAKNGVEFKRTGPPTASDTADIPLGTRGTIKGIEYEVIGLAVKEELNPEHARWKEYTLFNTAEGFAFLSEFQGHWVYVRENPDAPVIRGKDLEEGFIFNGQTFRLFNAYKYQVRHAQGEFPYNISDTSNTEAREFISPPHIWIREKDDLEGSTWFKGEHIPTRELKKAFVFPDGTPSSVGIGTVQPAGFVTPVKLIGGTIIAAIALVLLHFALSAAKQNRNLIDRDFYFSDSTNHVTFVSEKFNLDKSSSNLAFDIYAPVDNNWFELDATLVNSTTGKEYSMEQGVEYYHGYSDGESWSEGSKTETAYIDQVPPGTYYLQIQGTRETGTWLQSINSFHATVKYDVATERNMWIAVLLVVVWAFILYARSRFNEQRRWYNSPYSPYNTEEQ